jgi:ligand-binding sensor domain-containing protein/signal transduction histidine kinase
MFQDSKGFLWFGSMYGLIKFDGIKYTTYRYNPADNNSLSSDDILSIYEDSKGYLWIGTFNGGVNRYDRRSGIFKRYIHDAAKLNTISNNTVWSICEDKEGAIWFGTGNGLNKLPAKDSSNEAFIRYSFGTAQNGKPAGQINSIVMDDEGVLWLGTFGRGLTKLVKSTDGNHEKDTFVSYTTIPEDSTSISGNLVRSLYIDKEGFIWAGMSGAKLNRFDKRTGKFTRFEGNEGNEGGLEIRNVNAIDEDAGGNLWLALNKGFAKYDKVNNRFVRYSINTPGSWKSELIVALCIDRSGILWTGTYYGGLHKVFLTPDRFKTVKSNDGSQNPLSSNFLGSVLEDSRGNIWIGTSLGLDLFKSKAYGMFDSSNVYHFKDTSTKGGLNANAVNALLEDRDGNIWIGANNGLRKYNPSTGQYERYNREPANGFSLSGDMVYSIAEDKEGNIWVGTGNGLNRLNRHDAEGKRFTRYQHREGDKTSLNNNAVLSLYIDKSGNLWAGTYEGLNLYNKETDNFTSYSKDPYNPNTLSNNYIYSYCEDSYGNFWIGTGGGLNKFIKEENKFEHFTEEDGLANSVICGIVEDGGGNLWISTNKGLSRYNILSGIFKNYDVEDGLQSNMYNQGVALKRRNGEIIFGGIDGFNIFDPAAVTDNNFKAPVVISSLVKFKENRYMETDVSSTEAVELNYNENFFSMEFASMDYTNPQKNEYAYMLEGFDNDWIYNGSNNQAVYTNLDPGEYRFKVKATNSDGIWNDSPAVLTIKVVPPFWKTWWFYTLSAVLTGFAAAGFYNYKVRRKVKRLLEIERIKSLEREKVREQASKDYHDELGHKLTRISLYGRRINRKMNGEMNGITGEINSIIETSNSLRDSAKDLIWALNPEEDTLYDFCVRLKNFGNELYEETGISFNMDESPESFKSVSLGMDYKRNMIYIFKEAMNNALKYARCRNVTMEVLFKDSLIKVILTDDGTGFDKDNASKGYGLKNIVSRAKYLNGRIDISSCPGNGTRVELSIDINKFHIKSL